MHYFVALKFFPFQIIEFHTACQDISFPAWIFISLNEDYITHGYRWPPVDNRLFHSRKRSVFRNDTVIIVYAERYFRPPIIAALADDVELITTLRAMLCFP